VQADSRCAVTGRRRDDPDHGSAGDGRADGNVALDRLEGAPQAALVSHHDDPATGKRAGVGDSARRGSEDRLPRAGGQVDTPMARQPRLVRRVEAALDGGLRVEWPGPPTCGSPWDDEVGWGGGISGHGRQSARTRR